LRRYLGKILIILSGWYRIALKKSVVFGKPFKKSGKKKTLGNGSAQAAETTFLWLFFQFPQLVFYSPEMVTFAPQKQSGFFRARKPLISCNSQPGVEKGRWCRAERSLKTRIAQNLNVLIYNNGRLKISKKLWYCGAY
jgi:hypothetical protein